MFVRVTLLHGDARKGTPVSEIGCRSPENPRPARCIRPPGAGLRHPSVRGESTWQTSKPKHVLTSLASVAFARGRSTVATIASQQAAKKLRLPATANTQPVPRDKTPRSPERPGRAQPAVCLINLDYPLSVLEISWGNQGHFASAGPRSSDRLIEAPASILNM